MAEMEKGDSEQDLSNSESSLPEFVPPLNGSAADTDENSVLPDDVDVVDKISEDGTTIDAPEWVAELRQLLDEQCGLHDVVRITEGRHFPPDLRSRAWQACLDISWNNEDASGGFASWDGMFGLESQNTLHVASQQLVDKLDNISDAERLALRSDIESVVTAFCYNKKCDYNPNAGWMDILRVLVPLRLSTPTLYDLLATIVHRFIPKDGANNDIIHHLFRLIVLYHDPELCTFLDSKKVSFERFSSTWFSTLFAADCKSDTILAVWDLYFQNNDPFLVLFLGLILLFSVKEQVMEMKESTKDELTSFLHALPSNMSVDDVTDFFELANANLAATPKSLRETTWTSLFGTRPVSPTKRLHIPIPQALCLPVTVDEIVSAATRRSGCRFFVVDCRPPEQYNSSHLVTAFYLDANLLIQNASAFDTAVEGLLQAQKQALEANSIAGGEHLCFMGSGFEAEDQFVHMVVARMLQHGHKFVSLADGGFEALLYNIEVNSMETDRVLVGTAVHKVTRVKKKSSVSPSSGKAAEGSSFFGKLKSAYMMMPNVSDVKEKLTTYITNPQGSSSTPVRHVSADDRPKKVHYRPVQMQSVFVFDDEETPEYTDKDVTDGEVQNWREFIRRPDVIAHFECLEYVANDQAVPAVLVISETHIYNFRQLTENADNAQLVAEHNLMDVLKIVCRRKIPELITIKYGSMEEGVTTVHEVERYYIKKSGDAIKAIKMQILKLMDENGDRQSWDEKE